VKILVAVKRVVDFNVKVRVKADGSGVETANVKMSMNPFDEIRGGGSNTPEGSRDRERDCRDLLRGAGLPGDAAHGARGRPRDPRRDRVELQPLAVAKICARSCKGESQLVILGKQAIDDDCNQTGQMLAALLGWSQATFASKVKIWTLQTEKRPR